MVSQEQDGGTRTSVSDTPDPVVRQPALTLAVLVTCQLMISMDSGVIAIAFPSITSGLGSEFTGVAWVFGACSLVYGGLLLVGGRAGDILGRKRMFMWGVSIMVAACVLGGLAPEIWVLITARALQGVGFALAGPAALSLIVTGFAPGLERTRALGVSCMVTGLGLPLGLVLGGLLTMVSWRLVFFVNVPIGVVTILIARRHLTEARRHPARFDLLGALTSTMSMVCIVYACIHASSAGWTAASTRGLFAVGALLFAGFLLIERGAAQPIVPLRRLPRHGRVGALLAFVLLMAALADVFVLLSEYLGGVRLQRPLVTALGLLPLTAAQVLTARAAAVRLIPRFGRRNVVVTGAVLMLAGAVWLAVGGRTYSYASSLLGPLLLLGAGLGLSFVALTMTVLDGLEPREIGAASGLLQAAQQVGLSLGVAIMTTAYSRTIEYHSVEESLAAAFLTAVELTGAALLVIALVIRAPGPAQAPTGH